MPRPPFPSGSLRLLVILIHHTTSIIFDLACTHDIYIAHIASIANFLHRSPLIKRDFSIFMDSFIHTQGFLHTHLKRPVVQMPERSERISRPAAVGVRRSAAALPVHVMLTCAACSAQAAASARVCKALSVVSRTSEPHRTKAHPKRDPGTSTPPDTHAAFLPPSQPPSHASKSAGDSVLWRV